MNKDIAYCGYNCKNCPIFLATKNNDCLELRRINYLGPNVECTIENHGCKGCKSDSNNQMCKTCYMKKCATDKKINNCGECMEYPCDYTASFLSVETKIILDEIHKEKYNE